MTAAAYIPDADATRGAHFRRAMRSRAAFWWLFAGLAGGFLAGAYLREPVLMVAAPAGWALLVTAFAFWIADRHASADFYDALSRGLGLAYLGSASLPPMTALLGTGDRRRFDHVMCSNVFGNLGPGQSMLAHYTYEVARGSEENRVWQPYRFTVFVTDYEPGMSYFRGIYLRRKRGVFEALDHDWLRGRDLTEIKLESLAFDEAYDLRVVADQDPLAVRRLFSPSLVDWLARHPLKPSLEYRAGTLVVYLPGHVEDAGRLTWFYESSRELAQRLVAEVREAA